MTKDLTKLMKMVEASQDISPERLLLGASSVPEPFRREVAQQLALRPALWRKLPLWAKRGAFVPSRLAIEQCSSEQTAAYKASFVKPEDTVADLTGGLGVDTLALASVAQKSYYVEQEETLVRAATHNFPLLSSQPPTIIHGDAEKELPSLIDAGCSLLYIDPARRAGSSAGEHNIRRYAIADCKPNLLALLATMRSEPNIRILAKLSTMLDLRHTLEQIPTTRALHLVSSGKELKELLLLIDPSLTPFPITNIPIHIADADAPQNSSFVYSLGEEAAAPQRISIDLKTYIYEPLPGLMKSGAFKLFASRFDLEQLHPNSHLYTGNILLSNLPARIFTLERIIPFHKQQIKRLRHAIKSAAISVRHFPLSAPSLRARLGISEAESPTIIGTTVASGEHVLLLTTPIR